MRRSFFFLTFGIFCFATAIEQVSAEARVFLLGGQSNMSGAGLFKELKRSQQQPPERVQIWNKGKWQKIGPGISANEGRFGPELAFGRAIQEAYPDDEIYLIKKASGGTSMHKHWTFENGKGPLLKSFLRDAKAAFKNLKREKVKYEIEGMLWMQGESDAAQGKGSEYEASLRHFIKEIRKEFGKKELPFIMGRILPTFDKPEGNGPLVRAAQERIANDDENVACFNTDDFARINKGHYNHEGQLELGATFAKHYLAMIKEK